MHKTITILFLCFLFSLKAQVELSYKVNANIDTKSFIVRANIEIEVKNIGQSPIGEIPLELWANAYQKKGTFLAEERLEDQKTDLYYSRPEELGFIDSLNFEITTTNPSSYSITEEGNREIYTITLDNPLQPGDIIKIKTPFRLKIPSSKFNGFGYDSESIRLANWFPKVSGFADSAFYPVKNSRLRYSFQNTSRIKANINIGKDVFLLASADYIKKEGEDLNEYQFSVDGKGDLVLLLFPQLYNYQIPKIHTPNTNVFVHYTGDFPQIDFIKGFKQIAEFVNQELGVEPPNNFHLAFLKDKEFIESSFQLLIIESDKKSEELEARILEEWIKIILTEQVNVNAAKYPWMVNGLAHYYKTLYFRTYYPDKKYLGWAAKTKVGKIFEADEYPYEYRNTFLYHFMARQGLDQSIADSAAAFPKFNYQAIVQGKTALSLDYLRLYVGEKDFQRSVKKFISDNNQQHSGPNDFVNSFSFYENKDLTWFLDDLYNTSKKYNYKLKKTEDCSYIYTATIKNKGQINTPYSLTGVKDEEPVLTEWFPGHEGKKTVQMHLEEYDEVVLNYTGRFPEFYQKNNSLKTSGILKRSKPLRLQFYTSFENPKKAQLFWLPNLKYNAYDKFLIGAQFYNTTLVHKPFEYRISPDFSTGTGKLVGSGSLKYNWTPVKGPFHLISAALYGRYYHYAKDLAYTRLSPTVKFNFRKSNPRSNILQDIRLRGVLMDRELPEGFKDSINSLSYASYQVADVRYTRENVHVLHPNKLTVDFQGAEEFSKLQVDFMQRWRLSKNHTLGLRAFAGTFLHNNNTEQDNYYSFGLSGTQDYLFDYYFLGRSDTSGIWSQQMFTTDGGFKTQTNVYSNTSMVAFNAQIPVWRYFKIFGDISWHSQSNTLYWDYGIGIILVPDFIEVYFPIQSNTTNYYNTENYHLSIRYVLNLDFTQIVNRLRRGYY